MAPNEVLERLTQMAELAINREGFAASRSCRHHIQNKIVNITSRISKKIEGSPTWVSDLHFAEVLTTQLVHEMAMEGKNRGYTELHPDTFFAALDRMGPIALLAD